MDQLMPSYSHVAITKLLNDGVVKFIISSNHDNLHIRSGTPAPPLPPNLWQPLIIARFMCNAGASPDKVSEIFGNGYIETCLKCGDKFLRATQVPQLGRTCDNVPTLRPPPPQPVQCWY
jgi:NAD-dependent SIR2 family protein deacetylase